MATGSMREFGRMVLRIAPQVKSYAGRLVAISAVYELIKILPPYLISLLIDHLTASPSLGTVFLLAAGMLASYLVLTIIEFETFRYMSQVIPDAQEEMLSTTMRQLLTLPMSWHEDQNSGSVVSKTTKAAKYISDLSWFLNNTIIPSLLQLVITGVIFFVIDWRIGLIFIVATPLLLYNVDRQFQRLQPYRERYHQAFDDATRELAQAVINARTVQDFSQQDRELQRHASYLHKYKDYLLKRIQVNLRDGSLNSAWIYVVRVGTLVLGAWLYVQGELTLGTLVFVITLTEKAYINLHRLGYVYSYMGDTYESLRRVDEIQRTASDLADTGRKRFRGGDIRMHHVDFSYDKSLVLTDINITIPHKRITALVGPSGSGKTTLVKLLMRHYDPTAGEITINGTPLRELSLRELRRNVGFVSQHTELFDRSIHDNIAYADTRASRKAVIAAAKKANAHDFIMGLPRGYDTIVGEQGVKLSGGQRQRLSIARALLAKTPIIIFDEATSSLDGESERAVQDAVLKIKDRTLIIIAHRLSTIQHADRIIVLKDGRVVEEGSHGDLVGKQGGIYKRMLRLQSVGELRR